MSVFVQYVPPLVKGKEWTDEQRDQFGQTVINQIDEYAPGFKDLILHAEIRTPRELENEVGPHRRQYIPGRTDDGPVVVQPANSRLRTIPRPDPKACTCAVHPTIQVVA